MTSDFFVHPSTMVIIADALITIGVLVRVVMKRPPTGVALAWLFIVAVAPALGIIAYLIMGERRVGQNRARRLGRLRTDLEEIVAATDLSRWLAVDWNKHPPSAVGMDRLGRSSGSPTYTGSRAVMWTDTPAALRAIAADVDLAENSVLMEFYIWYEGGAADEVLEAVIRAAQRGVECRLLVDALGARPWWKGRQPRRLREAGVEVRQALPVGLWRSVFSRTDLRLHRKIVVVDGEVAWTGSMNMVDPKCFDQGKIFGEWVDAVLRIEGTTVAPLAAVLLSDWILETGQPIRELLSSANVHVNEPKGGTDIQVVATGPGESADGLLQMLLAQVHAAKEELILTTPYFVPDESLLRAIRGAAGRGVEVSIIVPENVNSWLTRHASRSYYDDLLDAGVRIFLYQDGLLHTKAITADGKIAMFGTVNLDMRSLWLNYEVSLFVYDAEFAAELVELQHSYLKQCQEVAPDQWARRSFGHRFVENAARLMSPLL